MNELSINGVTIETNGLVVEGSGPMTKRVYIAGLLVLVCLATFLSSSFWIWAAIAAIWSISHYRINKEAIQ